MAKLRNVKSRISSVEKIKKITGALEVVALTRLKRLETATMGARFYFDKIQQMLCDISKHVNFTRHPLFDKQKQAEAVAVICITSDKGLCGDFNNNVFNKFSQFLKEHPEKKKLIAIGRKGLERFSKSKDLEIVKEITGASKEDLKNKIDEVAKFLIESYLNGQIKELHILFNKFKLHLLGEAKSLKLLPVEFTKEDNVVRDYIYEPDRLEAFDRLLREFISNQIHQAVLESKSAEEMARMIAMKNATESADEMIEGLTLVYHKERQRMITSELLDIVNASQ